MAEPREPSDFPEILTLSEAPLLVGGQAVNVRAEHFASKDARLEAFRPFISKDADIFGDRALAERISAGNDKSTSGLTSIAPPCLLHDGRCC
jgi:hypothetical protein